MRILSLLIIGFFLLFSARQPDSPHGPGFKVSCKTCHSAKGWELDKEIYTFNHSNTRLPLVGQHTVTDCRQCHLSLVFSEAKENCNECHNDLHQATVGQDCSRCHTPASWLVTNINEIHGMSRFPLLGAHRTADCNQCHKSESLVRFDVIGVNCVDCHRENYMATTAPNHLQSGFSEDCSSCHPLNAFQWGGAGFNHNTFPLVQGHSALVCAECHTAGTYTEARPDCYSCHQQDFLATGNPDHSVSKFSTICQECHSLNPGWKPATFNHNSFPLQLGHAAVACIDCHKGGNYATTPADCYACHQQDYLATTNPNHNTSVFSTACLTCHTVNPGWKPATFNHNIFPLKLGHTSASCADCHTGGNYTSTPTDCYSCHQTDYLGTTNPNHSTLGYAQTCQNCHTENPGWKPATFDHNSFPLTLGHSAVACTDCHTGGNYNATPTDCYSCHQTDFNNSINPNHQSLNFSTTCTQCHNTNPDWKPASYTLHDSQSFPIYSGKHRGTWDTCNECHTNTSNYSQFTCITCHRKSDMDNKHSGRRDYSYDSASCLRCHPRGNSD